VEKITPPVPKIVFSGNENNLIVVQGSTTSAGKFTRILRNHDRPFVPEGS